MTLGELMEKNKPDVGIEKMPTSPGFYAVNLFAHDELDVYRLHRHGYIGECTINPPGGLIIPKGMIEIDVKLRNIEEVIQYLKSHYATN
jgi:hypothetical protein